MATTDTVAGQDTYIVSETPTTNYDYLSTISCGYVQPKWKQHALLQTYIPAIGEGAIITDARLHLDITVNYEHDDDAYTGYHLLRNFIAAQATWDIWATGENWGAPGGQLDVDYETDFSTPPYPKIGPFNPTGTGWQDFDCLDFVLEAWAGDNQVVIYLFNNMLPGEDERAEFTFKNDWFIRITYTLPAATDDAEWVTIL